IVSPWPEYDESNIDPASADLFRLVQQMVSAVRNIQAVTGISPRVPLTLVIKPKSKDLAEPLASAEEVFRKLLPLETLQIDPAAGKPSASASAIVDGSEIYVPLEGLI